MFISVFPAERAPPGLFPEGNHKEWHSAKCVKIQLTDDSEANRLSLLQLSEHIALDQKGGHLASAYEVVGDIVGYDSAVHLVHAVNSSSPSDFGRRAGRQQFSVAQASNFSELVAGVWFSNTLL